jgi:hypothetical protein
MRQETVALPVGDYIDSPRIVLRDGTVASVRMATHADPTRIAPVPRSI